MPEFYVLPLNAEESRRFNKSLFFVFPEICMEIKKPPPQIEFKYPDARMFVARKTFRMSTIWSEINQFIYLFFGQKWWRELAEKIRLSKILIDVGKTTVTSTIHTSKSRKSRWLYSHSHSCMHFIIFCLLYCTGLLID